MPQTFLALVAVFILSTYSLSQLRNTVETARRAEQREVELAAADVARRHLAQITELGFDEADAGMTDLRLSTFGLTGVAGLGPDAEEARHEPADVRRHLDDERAARDRPQGVRDLGVLGPLPPQLGLGRRHLGGEALVELAKPRRPVQVGKGESGEPQWIGGGGLRRHILPIIVVEHLFK